MQICAFHFMWIMKTFYRDLLTAQITILVQAINQFIFKSIILFHALKQRWGPFLSIGPSNG